MGGISVSRFGDSQENCWQKSPHFSWQIWWESGNLLVEIPPTQFLLADLVAVRKSAGRNTPTPFLLADLVTVRKTAGRNLLISSWQIWWESGNLLVEIPPTQFLLADLVAVRKSAGRNTPYPISAGRFGGRGNLLAEIPPPHFSLQIWWQSGKLLAEIPPFLLADLVRVRESAGRNTPYPIAAGIFLDFHQILPAENLGGGYFYKQICWQSINLPAELHERPFSHEGNYLVSLFDLALLHQNFIFGKP